MIRRIALPCLALAVLACDDEAPSTEADARPLDATLADAEAHPDAQARPDAAPDAAPDAGPADAGAVCDPGERACIVEGRPAVRVCGANGRYAVTQCPEGEVCLAGGRCLPDPATCAPGARVCLDALIPAECVPGAGWVPLDACAPSELCSGAGRCRDRACALAEGSRSYLGCDYVATDLPNLAWSDLGGTPSSVLGVVITNPNPSAPTHVTVGDPAGGPAALVAEREVAPQGLFAAQYQPVTIRTEVRDRAGALVDEGFAEADTLAIPPGGMAVFLLPHHGHFLGSRVARHGWPITTDTPVAAYQFGPYCCNFSFTNDASLLLPVGAWGTDHRVLGVPAWATVSEDEEGNAEGNRIPATLSVIGTVPGTEVTIDLPPGASVVADSAGRVSQQGQQITLALEQNEVAHLVTTLPDLRPGQDPVGVDLTGARVASNNPVAVFSGHECTFYPQTQGACDHLEAQLFPTETWGDEYALAPNVLRTATPDQATETSYWKLLARDDDTRIELSRPYAELAATPPGFAGVPPCADHLQGDTLVLDAGEYCEFGSRAPVALRGDAPFSVMGLVSGQNSTGVFNAFGNHAGDPAMFLVPPRWQWRQSYQFLAPTTYFTDHLTVVTTADAALTLDGEPVDLSGARPIPGSDLVFAHLDLDDGPHNILGSRPFSIRVYAFDDYVSYAFTGGLDLRKR